VNALRKHLTRLWLTIRHQWLGRRYRRLVIEHTDGLPFLILPDVFNPVLFRTGEILARAMAALSIQSADALDLGAGSGIVAVFAARAGARVVAVDANPSAVRCAKINALLNGFDDRIEVRLGDLFDPVSGQRFDYVFFNPPFYRGQPKDHLDMAWRGEKVLERFVAGLGEHLTAKGQAVIVLSTDGDWRAALDALAANGFAHSILARHNFGNEIITVYLITQQSSRSPSPISRLIVHSSSFIGRMIILYNPQSSANRKPVLPFSLLALGSALEGKHDYCIVDGNLEPDPLAKLLPLISSDPSPILGVTVMPGPQLQQAAPLCRELKRRHPNLTIVWGGYFPTQHADVCLRSGFVDHVIRGHGELAFLELAENISRQPPGHPATQPPSPSTHPHRAIHSQNVSRLAHPQLSLFLLAAHSSATSAPSSTWSTANGIRKPPRKWPMQQQCTPTVGK